MRAQANLKGVSPAAIGDTPVLNEDAYPLARTGLHNFKAASSDAGGVVEMLLLWFDEMMIRLFAGEKFTAIDAVRFFGGGKFTPASRERRHSTSF